MKNMENGGGLGCHKLLKTFLQFSWRLKNLKAQETEM